jgi:large subunit ribosomal protein L3
MTRIFDEAGNSIPVTVVEAGPCRVVQKKVPAKHKYSAIQLGFEATPARKLSKPQQGVFEKLDMKHLRHLREVRMTPAEVDQYKIGDEVKCTIFSAGEVVDVIATSKGRGFQGVVKRYHFGGHNATHGTHEYRRHPGSIGNKEEPGRVVKGRKLPGQMGNVRITTQNIKVVLIDEEKNLLLLHGAVPGARDGLVMIRKAVKRGDLPPA